MTSSGSSPASVVFLDRDGVINHESPDFVRSVAEWRPLPGSLEAIARLTAAGLRIVVVSNQSGLARGHFDRPTLDAIHEHLCQQVASVGGRIDGIFTCPHLPTDGCDCRKPRPGLIRQAERALGVEARGAPFVGDRASDLRAARAAGCRPVLVRSGRGFSELAADELVGVAVHANLWAFVDAWLS